VVVPSNVPGPETVNVRAFVHVVIILLSVSQIVDVINEVAAPSATRLVGLAVFIIFEGMQDNVVVTVTVP